MCGLHMDTNGIRTLEWLRVRPGFDPSTAHVTMVAAGARGCSTSRPSLSVSQSSPGARMSGTTFGGIVTDLVRSLLLVWRMGRLFSSHGRVVGPDSVGWGGCVCAPGLIPVRARYIGSSGGMPGVTALAGRLQAGLGSIPFYLEFYSRS